MIYHLNVMLLLKTNLKVREVCRRPRLLGLSQMPGRRTLFDFCLDFVRFCQMSKFYCFNLVRAAVSSASPAGRMRPAFDQHSRHFDPKHRIFWSFWSKTPDILDILNQNTRYSGHFDSKHRIFWTFWSKTPDILDILIQNTRYSGHFEPKHQSQNGYLDSISMSKMHHIVQICEVADCVSSLCSL